MLKVERNALSKTLNEAGIKGETKNFTAVTLNAFQDMVKAIKAKVKPADLMAEYNLNLQEARLFHNA